MAEAACKSSEVLRRSMAVDDCQVDGRSEREPPLPGGWFMHRCPVSGCPYYHHPTTDTTTWNRPDDVPHIRACAPLPAPQHHHAAPHHALANQLTSTCTPADDLPDHLKFLASMPKAYMRGFKVPLNGSRSCWWHSAKGDGNTGALKVCVGSYNIIGDQTELWQLFTSLEVTLFRDDRQMWPQLRQLLEQTNGSGECIILNGKPQANRWLHVVCSHCGEYVFVPFPARFSGEQMAEGRRRLLSFCMLPHRPDESHVRREV